MKKNESGYFINRHSSFLLQYHLVLVTKNRHPVLTGDIETAVMDEIRNYMEGHGMNVMEMKTKPDHVHVLFEAMPNVNLSVFVNNLKTITSRNIRKRFSEELKPFYWKPYFWSQTYFIGSVSEKTTEVVREYIKNQKREA